MIEWSAEAGRDKLNSPELKLTQATLDMPNALRKILHRWQYGREVIIVSGLPRSGTSMMMKMLEAGGLEVMTDNERHADIDNPKGYFEFEAVKNLEIDPDKSWVRKARGKVLKVISHLLRELPADNSYRILFMRRNLDEVIASQNKMLDHRGESNPVEDKKAKELFRKHIINTKVLVRTRPNLEMMEVRYTDVLEQPEVFAQRVNEFLGHVLDSSRMASVVDRQLYRNRVET